MWRDDRLVGELGCAFERRERCVYRSATCLRRPCIVDDEAVVGDRHLDLDQNRIPAETIIIDIFLRSEYPLRELLQFLKRLLPTLLQVNLDRLEHRIQSVLVAHLDDPIGGDLQGCGLGAHVSEGHLRDPPVAGDDVHDVPHLFSLAEQPHRRELDPLLVDVGGAR